MKNIFYILIVSTILISCKEKEIQTEQTPQTNQTRQDSVILKELEERKSIHQQEWEEHQKDVVDTVKTTSSF